MFVCKKNNECALLFDSGLKYLISWYSKVNHYFKTCQLCLETSETYLTDFFISITVPVYASKKNNESVLLFDTGFIYLINWHLNVNHHFKTCQLCLEIPEAKLHIQLFKDK